MDLSGLRIMDPMKLDFVRETNYINVSSYKLLRITTMSDCALEMRVSFSLNGINEGPSSTYMLQPNVWMMRKCEVLLPYCRIQLIRADGVENNLLVVNVLGNRGFIQNEPANEPVAGPVVSEEEPKRSKSPFRKFVANKKEALSQKIQVNDPRIPDYVSKNCILLGGFSNSLTTIPPPTRGEDSHLVYKNDTFSWEPLAEKKISWKV